MLVNHRKAAGTDITGFTIGFGQGKLTADSYILDVLLYVKSSTPTNTSEATGQTSSSSSSSSLVVAKGSSASGSSSSEVSWEPCAYEDSSSGGRMEVIRVALRKYTVIIHLHIHKHVHYGIVVYIVLVCTPYTCHKCILDSIYPCLIYTHIPYTSHLLVGAVYELSQVRLTVPKDLTKESNRWNILNTTVGVCSVVYMSILDAYIILYSICIRLTV